jgi:hypothetical protein
MYLLNRSIPAVVPDSDRRGRIDMIPAGSLVRLQGPSTLTGLVEVIWKGIRCNVFLVDLCERSERSLAASA